MCTDEIARIATTEKVAADAAAEKANAEKDIRMRLAARTPPPPGYEAPAFVAVAVASKNAICQF
jgi:hypothetical protein